VLFSVGLIPENELTKEAGIEMDRITNGPSVNQYMETSKSGVFACGNVVHVNDLVDNVSSESEQAGRYAAKYAKGELNSDGEITAITGENVRYLCPQKVLPNGEEVSLYFRVLAPKKDVVIIARDGENILYKRKAIKVNPGEIEKVTVNTSGIKELIVEVKEA
jgi:NADH dehydrogenase FAD-containing subunit